MVQTAGDPHQHEPRRVEAEAESLRRRGRSWPTSCAAVLILLIASGLIRTGWSISHEIRTANRISTSRLTTAIASQEGIPAPRQGRCRC